MHQRIASGGHVVTQLLAAVGKDGDRCLVLAECELVVLQLAQGMSQERHLFARAIVGRRELVTAAFEDFPGRGFADKAPGLHGRHFKRDRQQLIHHGRAAGARILLETIYPCVSRSLGMPDFDSVATKHQTILVDR